MAQGETHWHILSHSRVTVLGKMRCTLAGRDSVLLHGALTGDVAHLLAVVALRVGVALRAVASDMVTLTTPVACAVALVALARQVASVATVVALAIVRAPVHVWAVASQVSRVAAAEAWS